MSVSLSSRPHTTHRIPSESRGGMALGGTTTTGQGQERIRARATPPTRAALAYPVPPEHATISSASSLSATESSSLAGSPRSNRTSVPFGNEHSSAIDLSFFLMLRARTTRGAPRPKGRPRPPSATWTSSAREPRSRASRAATEAARTAPLESSIPHTMHAPMASPFLSCPTEAPAPGASPPWGAERIAGGGSYPQASAHVALGVAAGSDDADQDTHTAR